MPLISGGFYQSAQGRRTIEALIALTSKQIASHETIIRDDEAGMLVIAGKQEMESDAEHVQVLSDGKSIFVGRLFSKDKASATVENVSIEAVNASKGRILAEKYWGRYLLVSFDIAKKTVTLYRDPQGLSTLFYMHCEGAIIFSTDLQFMYDAIEKKPELNWKYLASFVANAHNITNVTPFVGITEAYPGCATQLCVDGVATITDFWDPTAIKSPLIKDEKAFQEEIYETFASCTAALARGTHKMAVELSGGLDSSSVLSVLKDVMPQKSEIVGVNMMHSQVASSNEVEYAKNVADLCNVSLTVIDERERKPFVNIKIARRFNRPSSFLFQYDPNDAFAAACPLGKQDEIICGQGGDHLFLAPPPVDTIADYFLEQGIGGIGSKISEISAHNRMPYVRVLGTALKSLAQYAAGTMGYISLSMATDAPWINPSCKALIDPSIYQPPIWKKLKKVSPAKAQHIFAIYQATLYVDRGYRIPGKPVLNPLLAQPLVELALSMPTYQSFGNGYDRVLFRRAMDTHKKGNFIWRKSKGETSGMLILTLRNSYEPIRKLLLEGRFAQKGLVDTQKLETSLNEFRHGKTENLWPVLNLMVVEIWLQSWDL